MYIYHIIYHIQMIYIYIYKQIYRSLIWVYSFRIAQNIHTPHSIAAGVFLWYSCKMTVCRWHRLFPCQICPSLMAWDHMPRGTLKNNRVSITYYSNWQSEGWERWRLCSLGHVSWAAQVGSLFKDIELLTSCLLK